VKTPSSAGARIVLIVDDRAETRLSLGQVLKHSGFAVREADTVPAALRILGAAPVDVVLSDIRLEEDDDGIRLLERARVIQPRLPFVLYTGFGSAADAVRAMKLGAEDYLHWPVPSEQIVDALNRALDKRGHLPRESSWPDDAEPWEIVAHSAAMARVVEWTDRAAATDLPVLIVGETGTGKELVARRIHGRSRRSRGPFIAVNCGAIPAGLLETELFGHRKGAFTSAAGDRVGLIEEAAGGSLFLDEIGELPLEMQAAVLRFVDRREVRQIGDNRTRRVDVRLVSATNRSLDQEIQHARFRADLYFRLATLTCVLPPLRDRPEDLEEYVDKWLADTGPVTGVRRIAPEALARLCRHGWPGNFRELHHVLVRAGLTAAGTIELVDVEQALQGTTALLAASGPEAPESPARRELRLALEQHHWILSRTAAHLGISRVQLWRRMNAVGLRKGTFGD
jgi:DNA-binding NtrC family response regulator